jgi:voltage-gated potassium channel Kch
MWKTEKMESSRKYFPQQRPTGSIRVQSPKIEETISPRTSSRMKQEGKLPNIKGISRLSRIEMIDRAQDDFDFDDPGNISGDEFEVSTLEESTQKGIDAGPGSFGMGLRSTPMSTALNKDYSLQSKLKVISLWTFMLALISVILAFLHIEASYWTSNFSFSNPYYSIPYYFGIVLLSFLSLCLSIVTLFLLVSVTLTYFLEFRRRKLRNPLMEKDTMLRPKYMWSLLLELFVCSLHVPFGADLLLWYFFQYTFEPQLSVLDLVVIARLYLLIRLFRNYTLLANTGGRIVGAVTGNSFSFIVVARATFYRHPAKLGFAVSLASFLAASYAIYAIERISVANFSFGDAMWMTIVTMTSVGYGDVVPTTAAGRVVMAVAALVGLLIVATSVRIVSEMLELTRKQERIVDFLTLHEDAMKLRELAALSLQAFFAHVLTMKKLKEKYKDNDEKKAGISLMYRHARTYTRLLRKLQRFRSQRINNQGANYLPVSNNKLMDALESDGRLLSTIADATKRMGDPKYSAGKHDSLPSQELLRQSASKMQLASLTNENIRIANLEMEQQALKRSMEAMKAEIRASFLVVMHKLDDLNAKLDGQHLN